MDTWALNTNHVLKEELPCSVDFATIAIVIAKPPFAVATSEEEKGYECSSFKHDLL
jgi:hypothetical protein